MGNDSFSSHVAGGFDKKVVSLYSNLYANCCKPFWGDPDNQRLIQAERKGRKPSFSAQEVDKVVNNIKPEDIAGNILDLLIICFTLVLGAGSSTVMAVDNIEFSGGYYYFASKGVTPEMGYSLKLTIPTGIDMKTLTGVSERLVTVENNVIIVEDSTYDYTLQWMADAETIFSNYSVGGTIQEVESKIVSTYVRKTVGFWTMFVDGGVTYWDIPNSLGSNTSFEGYYVGLGIKPVMQFRTKFGAYILNQGADEPRLFVFGLNVGYKF